MWNSPSHRRGRRANESEMWACHSLPLSPLPLPTTSLTWFNIIRYHASGVLFINFILYHEHYNVREKKIILQFCFCCRAAPRPPPSKRKSGGQAATVNQLAFAYVVVILSITETNYVINTRLFALVSQRYRDLLPLHLFGDTHTRD